MISLSVKGQAYNIDIKSWGIKDGLSDRQVNYVCKDAYGFIWLCTPKGLNRFDGYSFKLYNCEKSHFPFDNLSGMVQDNNGCFWIIGSAFYQNPDNNLFIFDPLTGKSVSFREKTGYHQTFCFNLLHKFNDSTLFFGNSHEPYFFTWSAGRGLHKIKYPVPVTQWLTWSSNTFWVVDSSNLFCEIDRYGQLLHRYRHNEDSLNQLSAVTTGSYSISKIMPGQKNTDKPVTEIAIDRGIARLIMYTADGKSMRGKNPHQYDLGGISLNEIIARLDQLQYTYCTHIFIENKHVLWMSSGFGLTRITVTKNKFRKYFFHEGKDISKNSFRSLLVKDSILYAINEWGGIQQANLVTGSQQAFAPFKSKYMRLFSIAQTSDGRLFGLRGPDLYIHDKQWSAFTYPLSKMTPAITWKIAEIATDSFLIAGWPGLKYYNLSKHRFTDFTKYNAYTSLANSLVIDIIDDSDGRKWIFSNSGLYVYDALKGITARYSSADTGTHFLPAIDIHHLYRDAEGIYWLGTASGLIRWDRANNTHHLFTTADGFSNNNIYAVYGDSRHCLWLSSDYGLMQFDKNTLSVKTYLSSDGISYNEFNRLSHTRDAKGNLYFGTLNGITAFNPDDFFAEDYINSAPLEVASFEQFDGKTGKLVNKTGELIRTSSVTLQPGDRFFTLNPALLTFDDALHTTYYWKIDEMDTVWTSFKEPSLRLSGLPYGKMTLRIKAQAGNGSWGANELLFGVYVIRPFYLRIWFIGLVFTLVAAAVIIAYRWRTYRLQKENIRLDSIVKEKTSELEQTISQLELSAQQKDVLMKEIHHRVKNNLQVISTLLHLQLSKISDEKAKLSLEESASRISSIALVHFQLYQNEEFTAIELSNFLNELLKQVSSVYLKSGQDVSLQNDVEQTWLDIDTALPLGLVLNELMTNSFKYVYNHPGDCNMRIGLERTGDIFTLRYCDYGPGLPGGYDLKAGKGLGMTIIKSLTKQLGGSLSYSKKDNCFFITFLDTATRKNIA